MIKEIHHVAIICADYAKSKHFYTQILGLNIVSEVYREHRDSYKLDLAINGHYCLELFSFPNPPKRVSRPEACGLRHLAFAVENLDEVLANLAKLAITAEDIRVDEYTQKRFTFIEDPDHLPIELYEVP